MTDSLINFGGAVKATVEGETTTLGGYLVTFGSPDRKDLVGDYFTAKTYYGAHCGNGVDTLFHHGLGLPVKGVEPTVAAKVAALADRILPAVKTRVDEVGIFAEIVLDMADEYQAAVANLGIAGKLGWSSGAVSHAVRREDGAQFGEIKRWIIGEASLTPTPCAPEHFGGVLPVKAYIERVQAENSTAFKTQYLGEWAEWSASMAVMDSLFDTLRWETLYDVLDDVQTGDIDWTEGRKRIEGALGELKDLSLKILDAIMGGQSEVSPEMAVKYLKSKKSNHGAGLLAGLTNAEFTGALLAGVKGYPARLEAIKAAREADGRKFPGDERKQAIEGVIAEMKIAIPSLEKLLAPPVAAPTELKVIPTMDFMDAIGVL